MDNTLSNALRVLGTESETFNQILVNMTGNRAEVWRKELRKFARGEPCWNVAGETPISVTEKPPTTEKRKKPVWGEYFKFVSRLKMLTSTSVFVAKEIFVHNLDTSAAVKIAYPGEMFIEWYLAGEGKTEASEQGKTLFCYELCKELGGQKVLDLLKGVKNAQEVGATLTDIFHLMKKQGKGEKGDLLTNGRRNVFFVDDTESILRCIVLFWAGGVGGWTLYAYKEENIQVGDRLFIRMRDPIS